MITDQRAVNFNPQFLPISKYIFFYSYRKLANWMDSLILNMRYEIDQLQNKMVVMEQPCN